MFPVFAKLSFIVYGAIALCTRDISFPFSPISITINVRDIFLVQNLTLCLSLGCTFRNARELLDWPIELKIPKRPIQLELCRYMFMVSYALIAALGTAILITVSGK